MRRKIEYKRINENAEDESCSSAKAGGDVGIITEFDQIAAHCYILIRESFSSENGGSSASKEVVL